MIVLFVACGPAAPVTANPTARLSGRVDFGGCGGAAPAGSAQCSYVAANGATVILTDANGNTQNTIADSAGHYQFAVPAGRYSFFARLEGWSPPSSPYPTGVRINAQSPVREILLTSGTRSGWISSSPIRLRDAWQVCELAG
jgi:hypothetical protein